MIGGIIKIIVLAILFFGTVLVGQTLVNFDLPIESQLSANRQALESEYQSLLGLDLSRDLFVDPEFNNLKDQTVPNNSPFVKGRPNPFLPIGVDTEVVKNNSQNVANTLSSLLQFDFSESENVNNESPEMTQISTVQNLPAINQNQ